MNYDELNPELFTLGILPEYDPNYGEYFPHIALCVFLALIVHCWYDLKQAFKVSKMQQLPEPDD